MRLLVQGEKSSEKSYFQLITRLTLVTLALFSKNCSFSRTYVVSLVIEEYLFLLMFSIVAYHA